MSMDGCGCRHWRSDPPGAMSRALSSSGSDSGISSRVVRYDVASLWYTEARECREMRCGCVCCCWCGGSVPSPARGRGESERARSSKRCRAVSMAATILSFSPWYPRISPSTQTDRKHETRRDETIRGVSMTGIYMSKGDYARYKSWARVQEGHLVGRGPRGSAAEPPVPVAAAPRTPAAGGAPWRPPRSRSLAPAAWGRPPRRPTPSGG